jgi:hypothetical protein
VIQKALNEIGFATRNRDNVLALEPAVALALIWDAQARGEHPPRLLRVMVAGRDQPPEDLRQLADFAIRAGLHDRAAAEKAKFRQEAEALNRETAERLDELRKSAPAAAGTEVKSDTVADLPDERKERPSETVVRLWREWWPDTEAALRAARCPEFVIAAVGKTTEPGVLADGTVGLRVPAVATRFHEVLEPVRQRLEEAIKEQKTGRCFT